MRGFPPDTHPFPIYLSSPRRINFQKVTVTGSSRTNLWRYSMKTVAGALLTLLVGAYSIGCSFPQSDKVTLTGHLTCPAVSTAGGKVYLRLAINTPRFHRPVRKPVNLSVVLDRSGSMSEESKIDYAKAALRALVDQLRPEDIFSLVIYDDVVEVLRPAERVGRDKEEIRAIVNEIAPRGWTNLGGGMLEGFHQVEKNTGREYINRVVLLSDGLANQGITDPERLSGIARKQRDRAISLSTIGVGLDYNENLMVALSETGGGNYYFLESSRNLASVLRKEFDRLGDVMAQNVTIELELGHGVRLLDAIGYDHSANGRTVSIPVGDLYGEDARDVTLELDVPPGTGSLTLASGKLIARTSSNGADLGSFESGIRYDADAASVNRQRDLSEQSRADVAVSTRDVHRAMESLDKGDREEATRTLAGAGQSLMSSPAAVAPGPAGDAIRLQVQRLRAYADTLQSDSKDGRRAKKAIQYENYQQQKQR
jgi:Ca-activated chloride channel homolog